MNIYYRTYYSKKSYYNAGKYYYSHLEKRVHYLRPRYHNNGSIKMGLEIVMIVEAIHLLLTGMIGYELYGTYYIGNYRYPISLLFIIFGLYSLYMAYKSYKYQKKNGKYIDLSICPTCQESYNYIDLKEGMCPYCDIKTVDIKEYYEDKKDDEK